MRRRIGIRLPRARDPAAKITFRPIIVPAHQLTYTVTHYSESFHGPKHTSLKKDNAGPATGPETVSTCTESTAAARRQGIIIIHSSKPTAPAREVLEADIVCLGVCGGQGT